MFVVNLLKNNKIPKGFFFAKCIFKKCFCIILIILLYILNNRIFVIEKNGKNLEKKKIGIVSLMFQHNAGNIILKYAMETKLKEMGLQPYIIGQVNENINISYLSQFLNIRITHNFSDIKSNEYDILMVNSDQTWRLWNKDYLNIGFLKFAHNWNIKKFVYGASIGINKFLLPNHIEKDAKILLKKFSGFSVREKGTIPLIKQHLGINPLFVLDPTLLIDKKYYLNLIDDYKSDFDINKKYICNYNLQFTKIMNHFLYKSSKILNYRIIVHNAKKRKNFVQRFLYCINNSQTVITDSYHGTVFSIIFNKPFISFQKFENDERFNSLNEIFGIRNRIIKKNERPNISLLTTPLNINFSKFNKMRDISNNFLKNQIYFN